MAEGRLKSSAGAEDENPRAIKASSLDAKRKSSADEKLIKKLFNLSPLDWARYPDDRLVFIASTGAKFSYTSEDLKALTFSPAKSSKTSSGAEGENTRASKPVLSDSVVASSLAAKSAQPEPEPTPAGAPSQPSAGAEGVDPQPAEASSRQPAGGQSDLYPQATE